MRSAKEVFDFVQEQRRGEDRAPLQTVTLYIGDWGRSWNRPLYSPIWFDGEKYKFECTTMKEVAAPSRPHGRPCGEVDIEYKSGSHDLDDEIDGLAHDGSHQTADLMELR